MAASTTSWLQRLLAALLIIALGLTGVGRAVASAVPPAEAHHFLIDLRGPICHAGGRAVPTGSAPPLSRDCCDDCALLAPVILQAPPAQSGTAPVAYEAELPRSHDRVPVVVRGRSPRQAQGPPPA